MREIHIDQLGRVVERVSVAASAIGCITRCRKCVYYSKMGALLPVNPRTREERHCKYRNVGPVDVARQCGLSIFVAVRD
jgi:hypothetical protein